MSWGIVLGVVGFALACALVSFLVTLRGLKQQG